MARKSSGCRDQLIAGLPWSVAWPAVERHLVRVLRSRVPAGVETADVIQETAVRLLASRSHPEDAEQLFQLSTRIAINLAIDLTRRSWLVAWQPLTTDVVSAQDVESEVVSRAELAALCRDVSEGRVDLAGLQAEAVGDSQSSAAAKSRRYRARKRLVRWTDRLAGGLALPRLRWLLNGAAATAALIPAVVPMVYPPPTGSARPATSAPYRSVMEATESVYATEEPDEAPGASGGPLVREVSRPETAGASYRRDLKIGDPGRGGAETGTRDYPPEAPPDHLVCIRQVSPLPDTCAPHPLRS